jgi:hypothetical protein
MSEHHIHIQREPSGINETYGILRFDGLELQTLEDQKQEVKKTGETRIPAGQYEIALRPAGEMYNRTMQDARFKDWHKPGMLWLPRVETHQWIYIHWGTIHTHTDGCIIVGRTRGEWKDNNAVFNSVDGYRDLYTRVMGMIGAGDQVFCNVYNDASEIDSPF